MKTRVKLILFFLGQMTLTNAYSSGAPTSACNALTPGHGFDPINENGTMKSSEAPVKLYLDGTQGYYRIVPGQKVLVKLQSDPGVTFKGFIIQGRDNKERPIGNFEVDESLSLGLMSCNGGQNNSLTHSNSKDKTLIQAYWIAPDNYTGRVSFTYSFVLDYHRYFTKLQLGPLILKRSEDQVCDPIYEFTSCEGNGHWGRALCIVGVWICDFCNGVDGADVRFPKCNVTSKLCKTLSIRTIKENWNCEKCQENHTAATTATTTPIAAGKTTITAAEATTTATTTTAIPSTTTMPYIGLQCDSEKSKILVAGGRLVENRNDFKEVIEVELIDLCNDEKSPDLPPLPTGRINSFGGVLGSLPMICGGHNSYEDTVKGRRNIKVSEECLTLTQNPDQEFQWVIGNKLYEPGIGASFVKINETWSWRLGGSGANGKYQESTEFVRDKYTQPGPDLPRPNALFSSVKINETTVMIIGGVGRSKTKTHFYDLKSGKWSPGPELNEGRSGASAGLLKDHETNETVVVVVGGRGTHLNSYEVLRFQQHSWNFDWQLLRNLPFPIMSHSMVEFGNDLIVIGGYGRFEDFTIPPASPHILRLFCINEKCDWETLPQKLKFPRFDAVAIKIPHDMFA